MHVQITYMRAKHNLSWHISPLLAEIVNGAYWLVELTLSPLRAPWHGRLMGLHSSPLNERRAYLYISTIYIESKEGLLRVMVTRFNDLR